MFYHADVLAVFSRRCLLGSCLANRGIYGLTGRIGWSWLAEFGKITHIATIIGTLLLYPAGMLADRYHPLTVVRLGALVTALI